MSVLFSLDGCGLVSDRQACDFGHANIHDVEGLLLGPSNLVVLDMVPHYSVVAAVVMNRGPGYLREMRVLWVWKAVQYSCL